jgi:hypothetical protein
MNAEQRKFLVSKVVETFNAQKEALEDSLPEEPNMNRFLLGAILEGSFKTVPEKQLRQNILNHVQQMGNEPLVTSEYTGWGKRGRNDDKEVIKIPPEVLFVIPPSYQKAMDNYLKKKKEVDDAIAALTSQKDTLVLKIQIGSNQILDKLILQVDSLGDLDLFSNKLTLIATNLIGLGDSATPQLEDAPKGKKIKK